MKSRLTFPALVAASTVSLAGCTTFGLLRPRPTSETRASAERVGKLMQSGELESAVKEARQSADAARERPYNKASLALSLQMLGLALATADRPDDALSVAAEVKRIPGTVSWMNIQATVALQQCAFDKAAGLYLQIRAKTPAGANDAPTEAGLAAVDLSEGRTARGIDRLEHALKLKRPSGFPEESWSQVEHESRLALAGAYAKVGRRTAAAGKLGPTDSEQLRTKALNVADYALSSGRALHSAYELLAVAILAGDATGASPAQLAKLRAKLHAVLDKYAASSSPCRRAIPDPLAQETPGAQLRLLPPPPPAASAAAASPVGATATAAPAPASPPVAPPSDRDDDGIPDAADKCPDKAEIVNGVDDTDGCPDDAPGYMVGREIRVRKQIHFAHDSAKIDPSAKPTLAWIAHLLAVHPEILHVSIEGHTDDVGSEQYNLDLSRRRALAVLDALVALGVDANRLRSRGFGESRPKLLGTDAAARTANRRVELIADLAMRKPAPAPVPPAAPAPPPAAPAPPPAAPAPADKPAQQPGVVNPFAP